MAVAIRMPDMGTTVEECRVLSWRVQVGEAVTRGAVLAEIETDKAVAELESTANGVMLRRTVEAGQIPRTGDILANVGEPGETLSAEAEVALPPSEITRRLAASETLAQSRRESENVALVSPVVRNLAAKHHVDLAHIHGTGKKGMITRKDVQKASQNVPIRSATTVHREFLRTQATVARIVQRSWKENPHLYISAIIDMSMAERIRTEHKLKGSQLTDDAIFLKAMAMTVKAFPLVAAKLVDDRVIQPEAIRIALAVRVENELFLPVLKDVDKKVSRAE